MNENQLATYVCAIHHHPSSVSVQHAESTQESWMDQGFQVNTTISLYHFDNGAIIRREIEQDTFPSEQACAECWITYEVLAPGNQGPIVPICKRFGNACRESFWLNYHRAGYPHSLAPLS
jgi:hypothetical protein